MTLTTAKASPPEGPASPPVAWHRLPPDEVLAALDAPAQGLPEAVSRARLARHGPNALPRPPAKPAWRSPCVHRASDRKPSTSRN